MKILLLIVLFLIPYFGFTWHGEGHRYTGIIAYQLLPENIRTAVLEDLKKHHLFEAHFMNEMPKDVQNNSEEIQNMWLFSQMAVWPDHIKNKELAYPNVHRTWHYINLPILLTTIDEKLYKNNVPVNTNRECIGPVSDDWNVSQAYKYNTRLVDDTLGSEKAIALCWVFHLLGDVHQPLHTSALFNEARFNKGDLGGNAVAVKGMGSLHSFWDGASKSKASKKWTFEEHVEHCLQLILGNDSEQTKVRENMDIDSWIEESHAYAEELGYPKILLDKVIESEKVQYGFRNPLVLKLDKAYVKKWKVDIKNCANKRIATSGFRLAQFLLDKY